MIKEYRTIQEVAGPLMLVTGVTDVAYNELGEIELQNGEVRRCRVLEVDGENALVQLFESSAGINLKDSRIRFLGKGIELAVKVSHLHLVRVDKREPAYACPGQGFAYVGAYASKPKEQYMSSP